MKTLLTFFQTSYIITSCSLFLVACNASDPDLSPTSADENSSTVESLDSLSDHISIVNAAKISGSIPATIIGARDLKFSIKDTLHLEQATYFPIKFLHDTSSNVAGIFLQLVGVEGAALTASIYFDVPEVPDMDNDTVSVVLVRFDPTMPGIIDVSLPVSFNIKITPHDDDGQPLDEATVPVVIDELKDNSHDPVCGLTGGYWKWVSSYEVDAQGGLSLFYNDPFKVWGRIGQIIMGSCCEGYSVYGICPGKTEPNKSLHFSTHELYKGEDIIFRSDGNFIRHTTVDHPYPDPLGSDFCSNNGGKVVEKVSFTGYNGGWLMSEASVPDNVQELGYPDKLNKVQLIQTSQYPLGGGYGNPGGLIAVVDCMILVLIQVDLEGYGQDLWKVYERIEEGRPVDIHDWYDII